MFTLPGELANWSWSIINKHSPESTQANPKPRQKLSKVSSWNETLETPTWENKGPGKKHIEKRKKWQSMKMTEY